MKISDRFVEAFLNDLPGDFDKRKDSNIRQLANSFGIAVEAVILEVIKTAPIDLLREHKDHGQ